MNLRRLLAQSLRMTSRDWRAGELRLLAAALVVAVAAVTSVGFLVDRIRLGLERDATQLLGADLVLSSDTPIEVDRVERPSSPLQLAQTVTFPSMAISAADADRSALSAVKAVSPGYPLRGTLRVADAIGQDDRATREIPARGEVWVDGQLLQAIGAAPGDALKLGEKTFRIGKIIAIEPDRGTQFINFAPRVMLNLEDLAATQLIANGSRVTYRLLVAGERPAVRTYSEALQKNLQRGQRIETLEGGRPEMQRTIDRAERFLASGRAAGSDDRRRGGSGCSAPLFAATPGLVRDDALPRAGAGRHLSLVRARVSDHRSCSVRGGHGAGLRDPLRVC